MEDINLEFDNNVEKIEIEFKEIEGKLEEYNKKYNKNLKVKDCNEEINRRLDNLNADMNDNMNYCMEYMEKGFDKNISTEKNNLDKILKYLDLKFNETNNLKLYGNSVLKTNSLVINVQGSNYYINYSDKNRLYYYIKESGESSLVSNLEKLSFIKLLSYSNYIVGIDSENNKLFNFNLDTSERVDILDNCLEFIIEGDKIYAINDHKLTILNAYTYEIYSIYQLIGDAFFQQNEEIRANLTRYLNLEKVEECLYINYGGINYIIDLNKNCITYKSI